MAIAVKLLLDPVLFDRAATIESAGLIPGGRSMEPLTLHLLKSRYPYSESLKQYLAQYLQPPFAVEDCAIRPLHYLMPLTVFQLRPFAFAGCRVVELRLARLRPAETSVFFQIGCHSFGWRDSHQGVAGP